MDEKLAAITEKVKGAIKLGFVGGKHWDWLGEPEEYSKSTTKITVEYDSQLKGTDLEFPVITIKVKYDEQYISPNLDTNELLDLFTDAVRDHGLGKQTIRKTVKVYWGCDPHGGKAIAFIAAIGEIDGVFCHVRYELENRVP